MTRRRPRHLPRLALLAMLAAVAAAGCAGGEVYDLPTAAPRPDVGGGSTAAGTGGPAASTGSSTTPSEPASTAGSSPGDPSPLPAVDPAALQGDIATAGSSTVQPLSEAIVDSFRAEGFPGRVAVTSIGTGAGFERFCTAGETDVANASRPIEEDEAAACRAIGREPIEIRVATDALVVAVAVDNEFARDLSLDEIRAAFSTAGTWADVRPGWPDRPIERYSPGEDSGTFDFFVEKLFDKDPAPLLGAGGLQRSEDDNVLVQGIAGSPYAVGFFGYAYVAENRDLVRPVAVGGIEPSAASVDDGSYPLSRPLLLYTTAEIARRKPQVAGFVTFYLTRADDAARATGYFPLSAEAMSASRDAWIRAQTR